ncbi:polyamine aminopropyltransferase [Buchananella hordeovulneris]|uniref:polyamine aminopropyltransferase n=1 Tax=Buchananella hordeovulneris TaxID=52770 RepID=UPI0026DD735C|nr:polyamine aminopropyltransferase [Buchananella hordeovulneris]MDO5080175.1 polyamine aminopropyltransferase [Buchananella hordeovulneris]
MIGRKRKEKQALFAAALLVAVGGIIYELILGTAASYLVGDSVLSFSLATGITLFGMGIGSLLAPRLRAAAAPSFALTEILLGLLGGNSVLLLYAAFAYTESHWLVFTAISLAIGVLIGLEIPLLVKMFTEFGRPSTVDLLSKVLALDYFGALLASLVFPLVLLPYLGLARSAYLVALLNVSVAVLILQRLRPARSLLWAALGAVALLGALLVGASLLERRIDSANYQDPVLLYEQSAYQKIVVTHYGQDTRLYLNNQLQFSSLDEARYHEMFAGAGLTSVPTPREVLILGGGDGLLAREVLRYPSVEHVTLVDLDPAITTLAATNRHFTALNRGALRDPRVQVVNADAFQFVAAATAHYDVILVDLVDPSHERVAKLYSSQFYGNLHARLRPQGALVVQATSSFFTPRAFATVVASLQHSAPARTILPFSVNVPSFGEWGFALSLADPAQAAAGHLPPGLRWATDKHLAVALRELPPRLEPLPPSTLLHPRIVTVYNEDLRQWRYY